MKEIITTTGEKIKVSDDWYEILKNEKWHMTGKYAANSRRKLMHRIIMKNPKSDIDHIDGNPLNNQIENLRMATDSQNIANSKISKNNKSGYKGVYKSNNKWRACIMFNGKTIHLGTFLTSKEASTAYNKKAVELFGEYAKINF